MFKLRTFLVIVLFETIISDGVYSNFTEDKYSMDSSRVLSRRKRFLIFPDGSSLQLVFCLQTAAVIPIGDIFLYSNTVALAWNLPTDPSFFEFLKDKDKSQRRQDFTKTITYIDEAGKVIANVPYKRRTIINPAFAKRSIDYKNMSFKDKLRIKLNRTKMHEYQSQRDYLKKDNLDNKSIEFHRNSRLELYGKIETLLTALGKDGRQCVLYKLCESAHRTEQGSFLEEFLKVVFTLPKGKEFNNVHHMEYDKAHSSDEDCSLKYPGCDDSN